MRWFVPSWNGDLRLESDPADPKQTILTIVKPTPAEKKILDAIQTVAVKEKWIAENGGTRTNTDWLRRKRKLVLEAPISTVGPIVAKIMRPGPAVLTAITFKDGEMVMSSGTAAELAEAVQGGPYRQAPALAAPTEEKPHEIVDAPPAKKEPETAVTVKRPTPSCPSCIPGAIGPASEVLLSFLNDEEHAEWKKSRSIVVTGGLTGHRYLLAHRHSAIGQRVGRICYDLDDGIVVHFHDWTVPPEEEVLAAKLILEHREPWLRNEATLFGVEFCIDNRQIVRFKNPFGDVTDGIPDACMTRDVGEVLGIALAALRGAAS